MRSPRVVLVTAASVIPERVLFARLRAAAALPAAARAALAVQLRDPELPGRALCALGEALRRETRALGASLVINDRLDLALALEADGVHLGRRSVRVADARALVGERAWVSVACHAVDEVLAAADAGASAAVLSPIFASPGKGAPLGLEALAQARRALDARGHAGVQVIALGGLDAARAPACFAKGASGIAAIRGDLVALLDEQPRP